MTDVIREAELTLDNVLERVDRAVLLVDVVQTRHLDEPAHVVRVETVVDNPARELVPLVRVAAVDADPPFAILQPI